MKIVVGLGNPGQHYADTPHSVGFETVDMVASQIGAEWESKKSFKCLLARGSIGGVPVLLVKPQTFMNLSGESVAPVVRYFNSRPEDLVVVQDDIDLPVGKIRIRAGGSCGGHNGVRNIIERLGAQTFARLKLGVGKDRQNVIGHVLGKFDPETRKTMDQVIKAASDAVSAIVKDGPSAAMNSYNGWSPPVGDGHGGVP